MASQMAWDDYGRHQGLRRGNKEKAGQRTSKGTKNTNKYHDSISPTDLIAGRSGQSDGVDVGFV